jgi:serpin B
MRMGRRQSLLAIAAIAAALMPVVGVAAGRPARAARAHGLAAPPAVAVTATNRLSLSLLTRLGDNGNAVFSPYSIESALAMVSQGAGGGTAGEIARVLGLTPGAALGAANASLAARLDADTAAPADTPKADMATLLIANGLWVRQGLPLVPAFTAALSGDFGAAPQTLDFAGAPDAARRQINDWIAAHTGRLIKNLMGPGSIDARTALVLADAIYLKALWASPFVKSETAAGTFTTAAGTRVRAPFMTQPPASFGYRRGGGYGAIDLPYRDSRLSMLAVMPAPGTLPRFERTLTAAALARIAGSLSERMVDLAMPRLDLSLKADLVPVLSQLGMPAAFSDAADFSGITRSTSLKIAAVEHAATLKLDEAGTVAAAATGISLTPTAAQIGPAIHLRLDHPFLLFLRDDSSGAVLFAARVDDPTHS